MKIKIKKSFISVICVLSIIFMTQLPTQAAEIDIADQKLANDVGIIAGNFKTDGTILSEDIDLPESYSSKDLGYTTPVRNQKQYNTCWAQSPTASLEILLKKNKVFSDWLSPMHMNYFATTQSNSTGWIRDYTEGAYTFTSMGYLTSWSGAKAESDFPYDTPYENFANLDATAKTIAGVNSIMYLDRSDIDTIKTAIYNYGSTTGNYHHDASKYLNASNYSYYCNATNISISNLQGHCVCVVGWDDNYDKANFKKGTRPDKNGAWLCKNSWGEDWGNDGYFWISYEDTYLFNKVFGASYAIMDYQLPDDNTRLYQNEIYGAIREFNNINQANNNDITYINVFDFKDKYTLLDKINFESTSQGSEFSIYYIPVNFNSVPISDQKTWKKLYSGEIEYCGYISIDIDDFTVNSGKGAIGIKIQNNTSNTGNSIGTCEWLSSSGKMQFIPETHFGDSYIVGFKEEPLDLMDYYSDYLNDKIGGTFVIKAIAKKGIIKGDADGDEKLTITDVTVIQYYLAYLTTLGEEQIKAADFDNDGAISIKDATKIQYYLNGMFIS